MTEEQKITRKLKAILSADVKGYSILMTDLETAHRFVNALRKAGLPE